MGGCLSTYHKNFPPISCVTAAAHTNKNSNTRTSGTSGLHSSSNYSHTNKNKRRGWAPALSIIDLENDRNRRTASAAVSESQQKPFLTPNERDFGHSLNGRAGWTVKEVYENFVLLGKGTFGDVWRADHKAALARPHSSNSRRSTHERGEPWHTVAIKKTAPTVLDLRGGIRISTYDQVEERCQEVKTLLRLQEGDPSTLCVLYLHEYFWTYNQSTGRGDLYLVTELLGEELDQWRQRQTTILESTVKQISSVLLNALDFLSSRNVVHRDLKLQNILFRVKNDFRSLKIVDFGLAKVLDDEEANDFCGSLGYIAPEIYSAKPYRFEVDMFAFGVILFRLLSAQRPFSSANPEKLRSDTVNLRYKIEGKSWENISPEALKLVRNLLIGPEQRYTATQASNHRWFVGKEDSVLTLDRDRRTSFIAPDGDRRFVPPDETSQSHVIALSRAPERPQAQRDGNVFWVEAAVERAVRLLLSQRQYPGRIIDEPSAERNAGLICLEESTSVLPSGTYLLPKYIAQLDSYTERECRQLVEKVALIIKQCHDNGMAHRNLLLTNLLVDRKGRVQIRGLQYAQAVADDRPLTGHFGYLYSWYAFKAPEIDSDFFHDKSVDLWSLGAVLYMLLTALPPFRGDGMDLVNGKHAGRVVFDSVIPSRSAQKLVSGLLQPNPKKRMTIDQVLNSEWMTKSDKELARYDLSLSHDFMQDFEKTQSPYTLRRG